MIKKIFVSLIIVCLAISTSGCFYVLAGAAGGAGTAGWLGGKLSQEVEAPFEKTVAAAKRALESLKLDVEKETLKDEVAQLISKYSDGRQVWLDIHKVSESRSKIEVRVGALGDKAASRKILDTVIKRLY